MTTQVVQFSEVNAWLEARETHRVNVQNIVLGLAVSIPMFILGRYLKVTTDVEARNFVDLLSGNLASTAAIVGGMWVGISTILSGKRDN